MSSFSSFLSSPNSFSSALPFSGGPMGPQDQKWKSMYYETANKVSDHPKVSQLKERFERHLQADVPADDFHSPNFFGSEHDREIKRQNEFLKRYSTSAFTRGL